MAREFWWAICLCAASVAIDVVAGEPGAGEPTRLSLYFVDGSHMTGTTTVASFKIRTSIADQHVPADRVLRVSPAERSETWSVEFRNGDRLTGVLDVKTGELATIFGKGPVFKMHSSLAQASIPMSRVITMERSEKGAAWSIAFRNGDRLTGRLDLRTLEFLSILGKASVPTEHIKQIVVHTERTATLPPQLRNGLTLYYSFDGGGLKPVDESGKGHHGAVHGADRTAKGKFGGAMALSGNDYIECGDIQVGPELTYAAWIKLDTLRTGWNFYVFRAGRDHDYTVELLDRTGDGRPRIRAGGVRATVVDGKYEFTDRDRWYHLAVTVDGDGNLTVYVNGEHDVAGSVATGEVGSVYIGKPGFRGAIDEVMIFNRALSETEARKLYSLHQ